jgi:dienelactone hydrolase
MRLLLKLFLALFILFNAQTSLAVEENLLYTPNGAGPFPAILMLPGSGGVEKVHHAWAEKLKQHGYVVYVIDSFHRRGIKDRKSIGWDKATAAQLSDIAPAYHYLETLTKVDKNRIALMGFSMGGYDTLRAMQSSGEGTEPALKALHFKAAAVFYGVCKLISTSASFHAPVKLFIGKNDDRSTRAACSRLVNSNPGSLSILMYKGAEHGFDNPDFPAREKITDEKGDSYHVGYNAKAATAATDDVLIYFENYVKG